MNTSALLMALQQKGWYSEEQALPDNICQNLLKQLKTHIQEGALKPAQIGTGSQKQRNSAVRGDSILWMNPESPLPTEIDFWQWFDSFFSLLNKTLYLGLVDKELHYAVYPPQSHYEKHVDVFQSKSSRKISFVLYLNEAWTPLHGGELSLFNEQNPELLEAKITPNWGRVVIFLSDRIYHQVNVTNQVRFSVTGWLKISH